MAITMDQVKELRLATWIWMMECKKALEATAWDMDKAIDELRKKGLAKAAKKADRETSEWAVKIITDWGNAYVVSIACETDFLANTDKFKSMLSEVTNFLKENGEDSKEAAQEKINTDFALEMWENLQIKDYKVISGGVTGAYIHSNGKLAALVVAKEWTDEDKLKQVAMHVTASKPEVLKPSDIAEEVVAKETEIAMEQMKNDPKMANKPEQVLEKILEGKINKFKEEISLLTQDFVIDNTKKVGEFIGQDTLESFERIAI